MTDRLQFQPYPHPHGGFRARKGYMYCDIWLSGASGRDEWHWSCYYNLRHLGWCSQHGVALSKQEAADKANEAAPEVEAELHRRFPDWEGRD